MEEEMRKERQRAEYMARAASWQLEKEEAAEAKVCRMTHCAIQTHLLCALSIGKT